MTVEMDRIDLVLDNVHLGAMKRRIMQLKKKVAKFKSLQEQWQKFPAASPMDIKRRQRNAYRAVRVYAELGGLQEFLRRAVKQQLDKMWNDNNRELEEKYL